MVVSRRVGPPRLGSRQHGWDDYGAAYSNSSNKALGCVAHPGRSRSKLMLDAVWMILRESLPNGTASGVTYQRLLNAIKPD